MRYYMAPLEEVTGYVFRNAYHAHFYPFDKYFAPFVAAKEQKGRLFNYKERNDILPENNRGIILIPQILTNNSEAFIRTARGMREYGYEEINLNLGCPSKTVVNGGRGSGFLQDREGLRKFLDKIFEQLDMKISIKTRLGRYEPEEIGPLMEIFNDYPLEELIIHPRVQKDFYKNQPNLGAFHDAVEESKIPLCYNGDIFTPESYEEMKREFPQVDTFMLGRGILMNPALLDLIRMREKTDVKKTTDIDVTEWKKEETSRKMQSADRYKKEIHAFLEQIKCDYLEVGMGEKNTLFKLKELWAYMGQNAPEAKKALKRIRKSQSMADYDSASREALEDFILF